MDEVQRKKNMKITEDLIHQFVDIITLRPSSRYDRNRLQLRTLII